MSTLDQYSLLNTPHYQLRFLNTVPAKGVHALRHSASVAAASGRNRDETLEQTIEYIIKMMTGVSQGDFLTWGIMTQDDDTFVGLVQLWNFKANEKSVEVGYEILPDWQRHGVMTEVLTSLSQFVFHALQQHQLNAVTAIDNVPSRALLTRLGFELDLDFRAITYSYPQPTELVRYFITAPLA